MQMHQRSSTIDARTLHCLGGGAMVMKVMMLGLVALGMAGSGVDATGGGGTPGANQTIECGCLSVRLSLPVSLSLCLQTLLLRRVRGAVLLLPRCLSRASSTALPFPLLR